MDDAQRVATEIALSVLAADGFILAGGQALAEHGVISRMSDDIDLFAQYRSHTPETFAASVNKITEALVGARYSVEVTRQYQEFASLTVTKDEKFRAVAHGKIVNGVLTTAPTDIALTYDFGGYPSYFHFKAARLRLELNPDGTAKAFFNQGMDLDSKGIAWAAFSS